MSSIVRFGSYEADLSTNQLRKHGVRINLRDQCFQVLTTLLEHAGQVVTREELQRRLWHGDVFVDFENNLNTAVARLREALCDSSDHPRFIETLPRRGYRFIALVEAPTLPQPAPATRARLVVLPFVNFSGDPAQGYLSDAVTDEIISALASLAPEQLAVIARTTAMHYKGSHKDVARISRELHVDYVVEGGVRRANNHLTINVQLIQTRDQAHLFAGKYEAELRDIFQVQSSIAQGIAAHLPSIVVKARREPVTRKATENLAAYTEYIQGRYEMWKWTPESVAKAKQHFEAALTLDAQFAIACDGLANLYWYLGFWGLAPPEDTEPIRRFYALRAYELDPKLAEPQTLVAFRPEKCNYAEPYSYQWEETERQMVRARELAPNSPLIRVRHASVLLVLGRIDDAIAELEHALAFDPLSPEAHFWLAEILFFGRRYEHGLKQARQLLELEPEHQLAHMVLGQVYLGMHRYDESVAAFRRAVEISAELPLMLGWLALALGLGGRTPEAKAVLERLRAVACQRFVLPTSFAWAHLGLGEIDDAFAWLERAVDHNDGWIPALKSYPFLDPLRADPRFAVLMRRLNLEP